jgi:two-component system phosphate regulon sensor histidine kinase PhoR
VATLSFVLGLLIGIALLIWQRSRFDVRLKKLLREFSPETLETDLGSESLLNIALVQQQQTQQQLEEQIFLYKQILQCAPIGYLQVDDENRLMWCNHHARDLLGLATDLYPAKPRLLLELVRSYELDDLIEQTRHLDKPCQSDWVFNSVSADPINPAAPQSCALRAYGLPLTGHQVGIFLENRQEMELLSQQRDRWASDVAHELKTPLTSIRLVAETLQTRVDATLKVWIDRLINETIRLSTLVQDLLELGQNDQRTVQSLHLKSVDLVELIHTVWHSLEPLTRRKQLRLDYQGCDRLIMQLDQPRIHRLLVNLLDNSIKYSPPAQTIQVRLKVEPPLIMVPNGKGHQVCLEVIDAGEGFQEKDLPYVFERFYRADPSRTRLTSPPDPRGEVKATLAKTDSAPSLDLPIGSGLGLAIVRQIAEAHQGVVKASNHPETGGAWLQVYLPLQLSEKAIQSGRAGTLEG